MACCTGVVPAVVGRLPARGARSAGAFRGPMFSPDVNFDLYTISVIAGWTAVTAFIVLIFIRALSTVVTGLFFDSDQIQAQREAARGTVTAGVDLIGEWSTAMVNLASQGVVFAFTVF
eukprot:1369886-Rhodomonas_salina.2